MSINLVVMLYLIASVCFIQALKGLSHPSSARRGNVFGMSGMAIAAMTTIAMMMELKAHLDNAGMGLALVVGGVVVGGVIGTAGRGEGDRRAIDRNGVADRKIRC